MPRRATSLNMYSDSSCSAPDMRIGSRRIAADEPPYVIAEMSANHGGDYERAVQLVRAAAAAGADAIKLQTYTPDSLTLDCELPPFRIQGTPWSGRSLYSLYREAQTPWAWFPKLQAVARDAGIELFSSPFDASAVDFLETHGAPAYKVASFELVDLPLVRRAAATGKPVLLSTGMAAWSEIDEAVRVVRSCGNQGLALLRCSSVYPSQPADMHLRTLLRLAGDFRTLVGLSDHALDPAVPAAAVALGAAIIEKHLTLSRSLPTADRAFSLEPEEFRRMVQAVRATHAALGCPQMGPGAAELESRRLRRSLFVVRDIAAGEPFTRENIRSLRPAAGLPARYWDRVLGRRATESLPRGTPLAWRHVD